MAKNKTYIISLGGSLISPPKGINWQYLKKFRELILKQTRKEKKFFIITGGGTIAREFQNIAKKITTVFPDNLDWLGIYGSRLNAQLVRSIFRSAASQKVIEDPTERIRTKRKIIIGAGWKPGWSTDFVATIVAQEYRVKTIINLSDVDYVYDKDPKKHKDARKLDEIKWKEFQRIVGGKWSPGLKMPFDPIASKKAEQLGLRVIIMNGRKLKNLENFFNHKKYIGTTIN
jgi:uridylate kinase